MKVKCPICGAPLENESCSYCGFVIEHSTTTEIDVLHGISRKSRMEALLLCIFLGGIGAHQFYVGKVGMGMLYLCTIGLFGVGWAIDIILIAKGSFKDEFDLPLRQ